MKQALGKILKKISNKLIESDSRAAYPDIEEQEFWNLFEFCKPYTMTSVDRMYSLYNTVDYILSKDLEGDFVECGVWRGGSSMLVAKMLYDRKITNRKLYLFDTFEGMSVPSDSDVAFNGKKAETMMKASENSKESSVWCLADLDDVKNNMKITNYPEENIIYVKGKVEDTLNENTPIEKIALLRLDTDWYESTIHEMNILFPKLVQNGVLIIDDYGYWKGCRKAIDEYFAKHPSPILMNRIDYTGRLILKNF